MKVAVIYLGQFPPKVGASGGDRRMRDIARGIVAQDDVQVTMIVPRSDGGPEQLHVDGLEVLYVGGRGSSWAGKLVGRLKFWRAVIKLNALHKFDWVLLYSVQADALQPMRKLRKQGALLAAEFCDLRSVGFTKPTLRNVVQAQIAKLDETFIPRLTQLNLVISKYLDRHVARHAPQTPRVRIPVLVDHQQFIAQQDPKPKAKVRFGIAEDAFVAAYVGGLWKQEGVGDLIQAFAEFSKNHPDARLIIAGRLTPNSADHDDVEEIARQAGVYDRVVFPGWISTKDVILIYSRANVLVLPQVNNQFAIAALPTKLAEYSIMAKPIIATAVGDVTEYFENGKNACLVASGDIAAIANSLERIKTDDQFAGRLANGSKEVAANSFSYLEAGRRIVAEMRRIKS